MSSDATGTARNRRVALAALLVIVVVILFTADSDEVAGLEGLKMSDVEHKEHPVSENVVDDLPPDVEPVRLPAGSEHSDGGGDDGGKPPDDATKGDEADEPEEGSKKPDDEDEDGTADPGAGDETKEGEEEPPRPAGDDGESKNPEGGVGPSGEGGDETASPEGGANTTPDDETKADGGPKPEEGTEGDAGGGGGAEGEGEGEGGDSDAKTTTTDETKVDETKADGGKPTADEAEPNDEETPTGGATEDGTKVPEVAEPDESEPAAEGGDEPTADEPPTTGETETETDKKNENKEEDEETKKQRIKEELTAEWGHWHFWDGASDIRPKEDYCSKHPHRDVPEEDFPETSWQVDAVYVNHYLNDAVDLVHRAQEAIYAEYGHGNVAKQLEVEELVERTKMFKMQELDLAKATSPPEDCLSGGGWTTRRSFDGLVRRLLHAMMTNDSFTVVVAGDGDAAGRGNHFKQSYAMEFHRIMKPIFDRLRVDLVTRNVARDDDLGILPNALGSSSIHGDEVDVLVWDGTTSTSADDGEEGGDDSERRALDLLARQAILGGNRVPILFGGSFDALKVLHERGDADVGRLGTGMRGVPETIDESQAETLPWAARYAKCAEGKESVCEDPDAKFRTTCWIERPDVKPTTTQRERVDGGEDGRARPGFRDHVLAARVLASSVLQALQYGLNQWSEITINAGHPLPEEHWHVTDYYENIRQKVRSLGPDDGFCRELDGLLPDRVCSTPLKAATEFTPRANPDENSLRSIIKPTADGHVPEVRETMLYDGPDVPNPSLELPEDAIDVEAIVSNRRRKLAGRDSSEIFSSDYGMFGKTADDLRPRRIEAAASSDVSELAGTAVRGAVRGAAAPAPRTRNSPPDVARRMAEEDDGPIVPGRGWEIVDVPPGNCDGTYDAICGRVGTSDCLLDGRMDAEGGLVGDERSGWLVMNVAAVTEGLLMIRLETDLPPLPDDASERTDTNDDGGRRDRVLLRRSSNGDGPPSSPEYEWRRRLETPPASELPDTFSFDYAVNGDVTALDKAQFLERKKVLRPGVEILTLLDESDFAKEGEGSKDVELGIRMKGCGRDCAFKLTHVYWA